MKLQGCSQQQVADIVLKMAGSFLVFDAVQKIRVLSDAGGCLKPHPQRPPGSILDAWTTVTPL